MTTPSNTVSLLRGLAGATVGGTVGYFLFAWLLSRGLYSLVLPGTLMGLACGWSSGRKWQPLGIGCAVAALLLSLFAEWYNRPFAIDSSLGYFVTHLYDLKPVTWLMVAFGTGVAYWFGLGRTNAAQ